MKNLTTLGPVLSGPPVPFTDQLRLAVASYLARFKGASREHTESDLRCYLAWYAERGLDPLAAKRPHLELYIRSMQEIRRFKPSTVSRRFSVTAGFYRTCVLDGVLEHLPAEHVRRPRRSRRITDSGVHPGSRWWRMWSLFHRLDWLIWVRAASRPVHRRGLDELAGGLSAAQVSADRDRRAARRGDLRCQHFGRLAAGAVAKRQQGPADRQPARQRLPDAATRPGDQRNPATEWPVHDPSLSHRDDRSPWRHSGQGRRPTMRRLAAPISAVTRFRGGPPHSRIRQGRV
jgi:hypothetical protein